MNEQKAPRGIEWTRIRKTDGTVTRGFTWNPVAGCKHACRWEMPDGAIAECYAKTQAENPRMAAIYPEGFEGHYWHEKRLEEPLRVKEPAGIFLDSMSDLMGAWVPDNQIKAVLDVCKRADWHTFLLLTKNAPRLLQFDFPANVWVGVSTPPDWMFNRQLTEAQQRRMFARTLDILRQVQAPVKWISAEPYSRDYADLLAAAPGVIQWCVVGAASNGRREYAPDPALVDKLLGVLDSQRVPVFFKGNMRTLPQAVAGWRAEFPTVTEPAPLVQMKF